MFFIPYDNWKTLFFMQIYRKPVVWCNRHVVAFFEASVLKEVRILYPLSPQNITLMLIPKVQNKASPS